MEICFGGNTFFTSKKEALSYARAYDDVTVYRFRGTLEKGGIYVYKDSRKSRISSYQLRLGCNITYKTGIMAMSL